MLPNLVELVLLITLFAGVLPLPFFSNKTLEIKKIVHFGLLSVSGILAIFIGGLALCKNYAVNMQFPIGIAGLSWNIKIDALSGFFFSLVGLITFSVAIFGPSYVRMYEKKYHTGFLFLYTSLFIFSMFTVLLAANIITFMLAWELLSLSSYFLVIFKHEHAVNRHAGFIYLLMAQLSGLFILIAFSLLAKFSGSIDFASMQHLNMPQTIANIVFVLALVGFGLKAGLVPFHVWLPKAHPIAPAHISALMSGVMLKVAVYGFIRFAFNFLTPVCWQWGAFALFLGSLSALIGVLYAIVQHDLKCLLAYHSVENIGIIFIGLGLSLIFASTGHNLIAALGLIAALYHTLNHALFKSLLFLGAGSIIQQSHEHDIENMGGLIHRMPQTAIFFLIGCISIAALPPFNGFVSEWLTLQTAIQAIALKAGILRILILLAATLLALTSALAATCFVKVFGIVFLGKARSHKTKHAHEPQFNMRIAMGILAALCLLFGVLPTFAIGILNILPQNLLGISLPIQATHSWLWISIPDQPIYYSPLLLLTFAIILICLLALFWWPMTKSTKAKAWDCGFGKLMPNMQYSATAFAMPIRRIFKPFWQITETIIRQPTKVIYSLHVNDWTWSFLYEPWTKVMHLLSKYIAKTQSGNVRTYLTYMFCVLIILLWLVT